MRKMSALLLIAAAMVTAPVLAHTKSDVRRLDEAEKVIKMTMNAPDRGIPRELIEKAECIGVFPGVKKAAFIVGGEYGRGVFTCRQKDGTMGAPAFFTLGGGSVGWQWGGQSADLVLLVMNENGLSHLLKDRFAVGGEAAVAAGPVGRTAEAATDAQLHAQILSWSRSRGLFLGASLKGTVIKPDRKANEHVYGRAVSAREILLKHSVSMPQEARSFVKTTRSFAGRS